MAKIFLKKQKNRKYNNNNIKHKNNIVIKNLW